MGDSNNNNRPLSPHLDIYQYQITWTVSIMHRLTGIAMMVGLLLITAWFLSAAFSKELFLVIDNFLRSWVGIFVIFVYVVLGVFLRTPIPATHHYHNI